MVSVLNSIFGDRLDIKSLIPTSLFYPKEGYSVGEIDIDLILNENHSKHAVVTENPLQDGRAVSDGIYLQLREGSLTALVSNHSLKHVQKIDDEKQNAETLLNMAQWKDQLKNRARDAWNDLKDLMDKKQTVKIVTSLETYDNVVITDIETYRDGETGEALEIKINFRQIQTVSLTETVVSGPVQPKDMKSGINRSAAVGVNNGQKVAAEPSEADKNQLIIGTIVP